MFTKNIFKPKDKSFNFDKEKKVKIIPWGKYIYFLIIYTILFFALRFWYVTSFQIHGQGELLSPVTEISSTEISRISSVLVDEEEVVVKGQPIVILDADEIDEEIELLNSYIKEENKNRDKDLSNLLKVKDKLLLDYKNMGAEVSKDSDYYVYNQDIQRIDQAVSVIRERYSERVRKLMIDVKRLENFRLRKTLTSPHSGVVINVRKRDGEVAKTAEIIMTVAEQDKWFVQAAFPQKHGLKLKTGANVLCVFPNKNKVRGVIKKVLTDNEFLSAQFKRQYGVVKKFITVIISVDSSKDFPKRLYERVDVKLIKSYSGSANPN